MPGGKRHGSEFKRSALDGSEEQKKSSRDHLEDSDSLSDMNRDGHWGKEVREKIRERNREKGKHNIRKAIESAQKSGDKTEKSSE